MASADIRDDLICSICLNLYTDPVTLGCGHSFCLDCINHVLDSQEENGRYSCPECREEIQPRPKLSKNKALCNVLKSVPITQEKLSFPQPKEKVSDIFCDYCIHVPVPALKSCLLCEASLCADHLRVHNKSVEHVLTEPTSSPKSKKCSHHNELLKYFCVEDSVCICISCSLAGEHRGHVMDMLDVASHKKKENLRNISEMITSKRIVIEDKIQWLQQEWRKDQGKAVDLKNRATAVLSNIRLCVDTLEKNVLEEISRQEKEASQFMSDTIKWLEQINEELCIKMCHIDELCNMTDPLTVLEDGQFGIDDPCHTIDINKELVETTSKGILPVVGLDKILVMAKLEDLTPVIKSLKRGIFGLGLTELSLDKSALCCYVSVSDDLKSVSRSCSQSCPQTHGHYMALSSRRFASGAHFWDVEMSRTGKIGLCYSSLRKENFQFGMNKKSWCLQKGSSYYGVNYSVMHDSKASIIKDSSNKDRFRIYLNYERGQITFYELGNPVRHLYTFSSHFTEPIHAAFWVDSGQITIL